MRGGKETATEREVPANLDKRCLSSQMLILPSASPRMTVSPFHVILVMFPMLPCVTSEKEKREENDGSNKLKRIIHNEKNMVFFIMTSIFLPGLPTFLTSGETLVLSFTDDPSTI